MMGVVFLGIMVQPLYSPAVLSGACRHAVYPYRANKPQRYGILYGEVSTLLAAYWVKDYNLKILPSLGDGLRIDVFTGL